MDYYCYQLGIRSLVRGLMLSFTARFTDTDKFRQLDIVMFLLIISFCDNPFY
ncbi:MAG: hypothetical protein ACTS73_06840 [Arsenophonus sp. NEOnobi-MAG3]